MTPAQKKLKELRDKKSKSVQRIAELAVADELTDETRAELDTLERGIPDTERQLRACEAAVAAEEEGEKREETDDPEKRERAELRSKARLTNYVLARIEGRMVAGAEAEFSAAEGVAGIPLALFDTPKQPAEQRDEKRVDAATPAPATGTGVNVDPVLPAIFARAVLPRLGVAMPRVGSGGYSTMTITTNLSAAAVAAGADQDSTEAALTPKTTEPHRVTARLSIRLEDVAKVGVDNFESMLRQNLMLALSDRLDHLGLTGDGTDPNPRGLHSQLGDPADPTSVIDFDGFVALGANGIDGGPWAETMEGVKLLVNADTMRLAETTFQSAASYKGEQAAAMYLRKNTGGFFSSARMPATTSTIAQVLRHRAGTMGLDGVNAMRTAVCPVWAELGIDDIFSDSASGTRHFTLHALIGDVLITQASAYERIDVKIAT